MSNDITKENWEKIGKRLKALRVLKGFSNQAAYARLLGYEPTTYNMWERGKSNLPVPAAIEICKITGSDLDYIYTGDLSALPAAISAKLATKD